MYRRYGEFVVTQMYNIQDVAKKSARYWRSVAEKSYELSEIYFYRINVYYFTSVMSFAYNEYTFARTS